MRLKHNVSLCLSFLFAAFCSVAQAADPALNGIAIHSELGKEQFIGALYSTSLSSDVNSLNTSAQSMRMELKIVAPEGMTTRRFSRTWIEGMAINSSAALLTDQADFMVKFDGLIKSRLAQNDNIVFSYTQTKGVNVSVNDVLLGNIPSEKFFSMLLGTWVGKVPLSSDFKEGILKAGNVNAALKSRFDAIKTTKERSTEIAGWNKAKAAADLAAEKELAKEAAKLLAAQSSSSDAAKQISKADTAKADAAKIAAAKLAAAQEEEDEKPKLTAQTLLARQFYVSDLLKKIRSNTRYPKRALERNQAGSVRVAVVIDRKGSVTSSTVVTASEYPQLNEAALEAISKSVPFTPMPDTITGNSFEFNVPTTFVLPK